MARLPYYHDATFAPHWYAPGQPVPDTLHTVGPFSFLDQNGQAVTSATVAGKIYLANFFFTTCPGVCPRMNAHVQQVLRRFADRPDVLVLSHSVLPEQDSVLALRAYAQAHGLDGRRWHLLTGRRAAVYRAARTQYFADPAARPTADTSRFLHTEHVVLVDRQGHLRGLYNGTLALDVARMQEDVALLLQE